MLEEFVYFITEYTDLAAKKIGKQYLHYR